MWTYFDLLPIKDRRNLVTLGEGHTPLLRSTRLGPELGLSQLYFKLDHLNPTGSYKDRFASVAVSAMVEQGQAELVATSSGNTGAALASYAARAHITCTIAVVEGAPTAKLTQMLAHGARLLRVRGFGTLPDVTAQVFHRLQERARAGKAALQVSAYVHSPVGMCGVETLGYELVDQRGGEPPDHIFVPVGSGGLLVGVWRSMCTYLERRRIGKLPQLHAVQPAGCATVAGPLAAGSTQAEPVTCTSSISGLQVASVIDGHLAVAAVWASGGTGQAVEDAEIYRWQHRLAVDEGIFAEPAGAAALAGVAQAVQRRQVGPHEAIVCVITGSGLKDTSLTERLPTTSIPLITVDEL